ncbi:prepilin-type N-terminal cleavage/methylation domain-containing protein [bacterium]|nr:prepilin-type N-terminal cleavage/methylation domain-containing protein [bacterium]
MKNKGFTQHHFFMKSSAKFTQASKSGAGFTLIELIIVIAIIALLAAATFVAVDPAKRIGESRNAQRWSDVTAIADAWMKYWVDHNGSMATSTTNVAPMTALTQGGYYITNTASSCDGTAPASCTASTTATVDCIDLHNLVQSGYLGDIPDDPGGTDNTGTDYYFSLSDNNVIEVGACETYGSATIKVVR